MRDTTAQLKIPNSASEDRFPNSASRKEPDTLQRLRGAVNALLSAISGALKDEPEVVQDNVERARAILNLADRIGPEGSEIPPQAAQDSGFIPRGGLAPWQVCKVLTHIEAHLGAPITTAELANLVRLSRYYFSRAFRRSFNDSPHAYLMRRRVERAQGLMLTTTTPLAQIAVSCGLADQAHLTRLFRRYAGESPGTWRRARATASK
jgi:AraC family transcriptional regulator